MTFRDALVSAYYEEPCQVLPNTIWKTLREVDNFETSFEVENSVVMRLEMWDEEGLHRGQIHITNVHNVESLNKEVKSYPVARNSVLFNVKKATIS